MLQYCISTCAVLCTCVFVAYLKYLCTPMSTGKQLYRQYQCIRQYSYDDSLANIYISDSDFVFYQYYKLHEYVWMSCACTLPKRQCYSMQCTITIHRWSCSAPIPHSQHTAIELSFYRGGLYTFSTSFALGYIHHRHGRVGRLLHAAHITSLTTQPRHVLMNDRYFIPLPHMAIAPRCALRAMACVCVSPHAIAC